MGTIRTLPVAVSVLAAAICQRKKARLWVSDVVDRHCVCGRALRAWRSEERANRATEVWAVDLADLVAYQTRRPTHHDILDRRGRRLQGGHCGGLSPGPEVP